MLTFIDALEAAGGPYFRRTSPLGSVQRRRLVENIRMESASLRPAGWAYPVNVPPARGGNLTPAAFAEATKRLDAHPKVRSAGLSFADLLEGAVQALNPKGTTGYDFFFRVATPPTTLSGTVWNVCSVNTLQYSFSRAGSARLKAVHDWLDSPDPTDPRVPQPDGGMIGLCVPNGSFWLSDESPLDLLAGRGIPLGTTQAARAILQELALPGFETRARRESAMGLVAIEFPAALLQDGRTTAQAWKPTAIDALNFKGYCFLPGKTADHHGLTWPLANCLRRHSPRDGLREFVHPRIEVPALAGGARTVHLLGFLDAAAETAWRSLTPP